MNIRFTTEYNGKNYNGFQFQKNATSIQSVLESALEKYFGHSIKLVASGRTDTGVHARGQVCSFQTTADTNKLFKAAPAVNAFLPDDIMVRDFHIVEPKFHARYSAVSKLYSYKCYVSPFPSPLDDSQMLHLTKKPNLEAMGVAADYLKGTHDFAAFTNRNEKENTTRTIAMGIVWIQPNQLIIYVNGDGFLRGMVRTIVGTLLDVGFGKLQPDDVLEILQSRDRNRAGKTAPAHGLCLERVDY